MAWPLSQDYNEAVQNPQTSFRDPELRQGQVVTNALGIPQPCSGNFADVYAIECAASKTKWAVKCFTREVRGLRERYSAISDYLQQVNLPFTVDFQYLEQGIRIAGRWYPILKMHWVEGFTLNAFVRDSLDKPAMLEGLSRIWLRMGRRLREAESGALRFAARQRLAGARHNRPRAGGQADRLRRHVGARTGRHAVG